MNIEKAITRYNKFVPKYNRALCIFESVGDVYNCYDGEYVTLSKQDFINCLYNKNRNASKYTCTTYQLCDIHSDLFTCKTFDNLKDAYDYANEFIRMTYLYTSLNLLKYKGFIQNIGKIALRHFTELNSDKRQPNKISNDEGEMIVKATTGAFLYAREGYRGPAYVYDYVSKYSATIINMQFPMSAGEYRTLQEIDEPEYGYYYCKIIIKDTRKMKPHTKQDDKGYAWYSHIDIRRAQQLNYTIHMKEQEDNCYIYSDLMNGSELFGEYINLFYNMKKLKYDAGKMFLNIFFGYLVKGKEYNFNELDMPEEYIDFKSYMKNGERWVKAYKANMNIRLIMPVLNHFY